MIYYRQLFAVLLLASANFAPTLVAGAASTHSKGALVAFVRADNVWIAAADGSRAQEITRDGTGTRIINGSQITYAYLTWSPAGRRLLVARFESNDHAGGTYRQAWSLQIWTPGAAKLVSIAKGINSQDFIPQWSRDGRSISYIANSSYNDRTLTYQNAVKTVDLLGRIAPLVRFNAREGCLDSSTDPSELTFWYLVGPGGVRQTFIWASAAHFLVYSTECIHTGLHFRSLATSRTSAVGRSMTEATLAPGGARLVGVDGGHLVMTKADGTARRTFLATTGARVPVWSPDGRFVYFMARVTRTTLRYRNRTGNLFEIGVNRARINRLDVASGTVTTILALPIHAFANLAISPDGRWIYATEITNSDRLYQHLIHSPVVTNDALMRYRPRTEVVRVPSTGGAVQKVVHNGGQISISS